MANQNLPSSSSREPRVGAGRQEGSAANDLIGQNNSQSVQEHRRSISAILDQQALDQILPPSSEAQGRSIPSHNPPVTVSSAEEPVGSTVISTYELHSGTHSVSGPRHEALPDLLHSHIPPHIVASSMPGPYPIPPHMQPDPRMYAYHHNRHGRNHRHHRGARSHRHRSRSASYSDDDGLKSGCVQCLTTSMSFRWVLVILSLLGVCCVVTGIVLAALHAAGNSFLFLAIMFIGLGILLVVVVAVGWKCTPRGHEPLHALFGLGEYYGRGSRRSRSHHRPRLPRDQGNRRGDRQWYGGVMYPEFQYRRPPPSYNASMEEYQQQLAIAHSVQGYDPENTPVEDYSLPGSPPPSYRSRASTVRTGIQITFPPSQGDLPNSRPPTYRSHVGVQGPQSPHPRPTLPRDEEGNISTEDISVSVSHTTPGGSTHTQGTGTTPRETGANTLTVASGQFLHPISSSTPMPRAPAPRPPISGSSTTDANTQTSSNPITASSSSTTPHTVSSSSSTSKSLSQAGANKESSASTSSSSSSSAVVASSSSTSRSSRNADSGGVIVSQAGKVPTSGGSGANIVFHTTSSSNRTLTEDGDDYPMLTPL